MYLKYMTMMVIVAMYVCINRNRDNEICIVLYCRKRKTPNYSILLFRENHILLMLMMFVMDHETLSGC